MFKPPITVKINIDFLIKTVVYSVLTGGGLSAGHILSSKHSDELLGALVMIVSLLVALWYVTTWLHGGPPTKSLIDKGEK